MGTVYVEGLGNVEIEGDAPTETERQAMLADLRKLQAEPQRGVITDSLVQAAGGIRDAAQNILNLTARPAGYFEQRYPLQPNEPFKPIMLPAVPAAETTTGGIIRGVTQFMVPYLTALKVVGLGKTALSTTARLEGMAILTEQAVFDPFDARLSDLVEQFPILSNPVTRFLAADPDDTESEARLKMALESTGMAVVTGAFIGMLRGLREMKAGNTKQALEEIEKARAEMPDIVNAPPPQTFLGSDGKIADYAMNVNLTKIDEPDDILNVLEVTAEQFSGRIDDARRGVIRDSQLRQLAIDTGVSVDELLARNTGEAWNAERILAARQMMAGSANNLLMAAKKASETGLDADLLAYKDALNIHLAIQEQVSGMAAEAGRALRQFQQMVGKVDPGEIFSQAGNPKALREQATLMAQFDDVGQMTHLAREFDKPTLTDKALEVWVNGLLSGPQTHAVNALSNTLTGLWSVPEHWLASGIGLIRRTEDRETFGQVASRTFGWLQGARDGFKLAARTFITEQPSDVFSKLEAGRAQAIGGITGQVVRLPGRALMASDEFFKSIGYRMELNSLAYKSAIDAGLSPRDRAFAQHMQQIIANPPEEIALQAIENARYLTFTKPLEGVSRHITAAQRDMPILRVVMPFVRTPTNIVRFAGERTPFGLAMREFRDATGAAKDQVMARMTLGTMAGATITAAAIEGRVTGSGPSDPVARSMLRESGWQPYSFVIDQEDGTKRYVAYNRVEPLGMLFGLAADFSQIVGQMTEGEADEVAAMLSAAISQNLTDKTFFKGLSDVIEAFDDPDRAMDAYLRNLAGSVVPSASAQTARVMDPILRDTQTVLQRIQSRIPGYSEDVPARLNLWGEPIVLTGGLGPDIISPLYSSTTKYDAATNELIRLELYPRLPQRTMDGEEIPQEEYWTFVRNAGRLAHRQIEALVQSEGWRNMDGLPETQRNAIRSIINQNRDIARTVLRFRLGKVLTKQQEELLKSLNIDINAEASTAEPADASVEFEGGDSPQAMGQVAGRLNQVRESIQQIRSR